MRFSFGATVALAYAALFPATTTRCIAVAGLAVGAHAGVDSADEMERALSRHATASWYPSARHTWDTWTDRLLETNDPADLDSMTVEVLPLYMAHPERPGPRAAIAAWRQDLRSNLAAAKAWESGLWETLDLRPLLPQIQSSHTRAHRRAGHDLRAHPRTANRPANRPCRDDRDTRLRPLHRRREARGVPFGGHLVLRPSRHLTDRIGLALAHGPANARGRHAPRRSRSPSAASRVSARPHRSPRLTHHDASFALSSDAPTTPEPPPPLSLLLFLLSSSSCSFLSFFLSPLLFHSSLSPPLLPGLVPDLVHM